MSKPRRHCRDCNRWRIRWHDESGVRRSETYGDYREASDKLKEHEAKVAEIRRGLRNADPPTKLFGELCDYWETYRAPLKRSGDHDRSILRAHLRPAFGEMRLQDVRGEAIDRFRVERAHLDEKTLSNHLTLLITMLTVAVELHWLNDVPKIRKPRIRKIRRDYRWLRSQEEIDRFLAATKAEDRHVFVLCAMAIYTGMRAGELAGLHWADINFDRRLITVQRSFDGPTKADDVRYVPILDPILPVLREWRLLHPGTLVFTNRDGGMFGPSARVFQEVLHRVLERADFPRLKRKGRTDRYITFHDLRHTFASHWVMRGGDLFKLQKILGHKTVDMTMRYAHLTPDAFTGDFDRLGTTVPGQVAQVVELHPLAATPSRR